MLEIVRCATFLGVGAVVFVAARPGSAQTAPTPAVAPPQIVTEVSWMRALCKELGLVKAGEAELSNEEMVRRLGQPVPAELTAEHVVLRTGSVKELRTILPGGGSESWLEPDAGAGVVVFRTMTTRPSRALVRFHTRGGPHLVSFGSRETRAIDRPADDLTHGVQIVSLDAGWMDLAISVAPGGALERVRIHPEAGSAVSPAAGWKPERALTIGALATTFVRLGRWEDDLPSADESPRALSIIGGFDHEGRSVRRIRFEEPGVYTIAARISGTPPSAVLIDDQVLFPKPGVQGVKEAATTGALVSYGTLAVDELDHELSFLGAAGAIHELLVLKRVSNETSYLAVARAHGFVTEGEDATAPPTGGVSAAALARSTAALHSWLIGPLVARTKTAAARRELPEAPRYPDPLSPLFPVDR